MKLRLLNTILNTGYSLTNCRTYLAVGSSLCHDLIKLDIETMKISYALDTWRKGRKSVDHRDELSEIWDKLQELIDSGEILNILEGEDTIENPITVYHYKKGEILTCTTDKLGWPNITSDGYLMHDNTYFTDKALAVKEGIEDNEYMIKMLNERLQEAQEKINKINADINMFTSYLNNLKQL
ncbi:MAG: hypothetical protein V4547_17645 [Bacteroidota bacterium]